MIDSQQFDTYLAYQIIITRATITAITAIRSILSISSRNCYKCYFLGCGTVRVALKLRFTGYRLRFTV